MKRLFVFSTFIFNVSLFVFTICCFSPQMSYADAPQDVTLEYNMSTQTLAVTITHSSPFPSFHHIKTVEIRKNAALISKTDYDSQPDKSPFIYSYKVPTVQGDKLEVSATCNMSGSKTATVTVSSATK